MGFKKISAKELIFVETYERYKEVMDAFEDFVDLTNINNVKKKSNKAGSYAKYIVRALIISSEMFGVDIGKDDYKTMEKYLERLRNHPQYAQYNKDEGRFPNAAINHFLVFINRNNSIRKSVKKELSLYESLNIKVKPNIIKEEPKSKYFDINHVRNPRVEDKRNGTEDLNTKATNGKSNSLISNKEKKIIVIENEKPKSEKRKTESQIVTNKLTNSNKIDDIVELKEEFKQDYSIWKLYKYGVSDRIIKTVMEQINSIFDLIILEKNEKLLKSTNRKAAVLKAMDVLEQNVRFFDLHLFENPFILLGFGAPPTALQNIVERFRITSINQLKIKSSDTLNSLMDKNMFSAIGKIKKSIDNIPDIDNNYISMKTIILFKLFKLKKLELKTLTDLNKLFPEKNYDRLNVSINEVQAAVNELVDEQYIINENNNYYFPSNIYYKSLYSNPIIIPNGEKSTQQVSLMEYLEQDFKDNNILKLRLQGKTLGEIGEIFNVSKERIRQRQNKVLKNLPIIKETVLYKEVFEKYDFSKDEFTTLFKVSAEVYEFLSLTLNKGKEDSGIYIINSDRITMDQKKAYLEKHNYFLTRFGELKVIGKTEFAEEVIFLYRDRSFDTETFFELYGREAEKYPNLNLKVKEPRAVKALVSRSQYVINTYGDSFRYYDLSPTSDDDILSSMINNLDEGCYSMSKLFNENLELMNQMELLDEYELHNLFKKKPNLLSNKIKLNRSPEFTVGRVEKKDFIMELFMRFSGKSMDDCVDYLYNRFGFRKNTMRSYLTTNFRTFINDNIIITVNKQNDQNISKLQQLKSLLIEPIYLKTEVDKIFDKVNLNLDTIILGELGYYMTGNIVFKQKFGNVTQAFNAIIMEKDIWKRGQSLVEQSNEMTMHLSQMERKKKLVVISEDTYVRLEFLESKGLNPLLLEDFVESIYNFLPPGGYFSLYSLNEQGFNHPLFDQGFEKIFYERLITTSSLFKIVNRNSPLLFTKATATTPTIKKFLLDELSQYELGIDIYDFRDEIINAYNIYFEVADIKTRLQKSDVYYSKNLEKLYLNKEIFLDEVYK